MGENVFRYIHNICGLFAEIVSLGIRLKKKNAGREFKNDNLHLGAYSTSVMK